MTTEKTIHGKSHVRFIPAMLSAAMLLAAASACAEGTNFTHGLSGQKPWTDKPFLDDPEEFHFAVIGDRTGGERPGFFGPAMDMLNLLRPEFVMSVGDLIEWGGNERAREMWAEEAKFVDRLEMPFFHVVGNHDIVCGNGVTGCTPGRTRSIKLWQELHGTNTYYSFVYKRCLFVCLDSMETHDYFPPREALSERQLEWAAKEFERHPDARWRFIFMHKPLDWTSDRWLAFERRINKYDYTVFAGDWHCHVKAVRHGKNYYLVGTVGGVLDNKNVRDDLRYGSMDSITWVTVTKKGPVVANIAMSGIHGDAIQRCDTTRGWIEAPLDYPSHLAEDPAKYADEKNTALIPAEVMQGPGYDWHFRHAIILRQGKVYEARMERFKPGKKRVVLLGDETASAKAPEYEKDWQVFDMGFAGDKVENVLWRVIQGELRGYAPDEIVVSVGTHNKGANTDEEIAAGVKKLVALARERAPRAKVVVNACAK